MNNIDIQIKIIKSILDGLYHNESILFQKDLCERSLVFRFAYHLQQCLKKYYVDCDYNASYFYDEDSGKRKGQNGKPIQDLETGEITGRFIDIIVHKRLLPGDLQYRSINNFMCFECKKCNNKNKHGIKKDINNLKVLTSNYGYRYGFHLIFGKTRELCKIYIYCNGCLVKGIKL